MRLSTRSSSDPLIPTPRKPWMSSLRHRFGIMLAFFTQGAPKLMRPGTRTLLLMTRALAGLLLGQAQEIRLCLLERMCLTVLK